MPFIHGAFQGDRGALPWAASTRRVHVQTHDSSQVLGITSLSAAWERSAKASNCCKSLLHFAALSLGESRPAPSRARGWTCAGQIPGPRVATSSGMLSGYPAGSSCHPTILGIAPGGRWLRQLVLGGVRLWTGITPPKSQCCWLQRTMQCGKNFLRGPEANCLGVRSPDKKAKEAFEPRKGLNGFTGSKEKPGRNKGKKSILSWSLQLTGIQERRNMTYNELGKDFFFWKCERKKYIVHTYFMLSNTPVWERNSNTDFCILKEKETGAVGRLLQPQAGAGETVLSGYFVSGHLLSCSIWVKADCIMAMLFRNHQTAQILISAAVLHVLMDAIQVASLFLLWSLYFLKNN